ncbi:hypothetical protein M8J75_002867 [Diaphorina citri]|nr:hypothetical protein M8J75_002867 [Diaphorina citri]
MSLIPYLLNELEDLAYPNIYDQHFGLGYSPRDLLPSARVLSVPLRSGYLRPWRHVLESESGVSNFDLDKEGLKVNLDVQQFKPEEIDVKVVDNYIVVHAKHEERSDQHGFISREFTRRYKIPDSVDANAISSKLSSDGVLSIQAPKKAVEGGAGERAIPVVQTNQPAVQQSSGVKTAAPSGEKMES